MAPRTELLLVTFAAGALAWGALWLYRREPAPPPGRYALAWAPDGRKWMLDTATGETWMECGQINDGTRWCADLSPREAAELRRLREAATGKR